MATPENHPFEYLGSIEVYAEGQGIDPKSSEALEQYTGYLKLMRKAFLGKSPEEMQQIDPHEVLNILIPAIEKYKQV